MKKITYLLFIILMLIGTSVAKGEEMSFMDQVSREPSAAWHVETKDGVNVCVPPPAKPHKKRKHKAKPRPVIKEEKVLKYACPTPVPVEKTVTITKEVEVDSFYYDRFKLVAGIAPGYTHAEQSGNTVTLQDKLGVVPGIGYERMLNKRWSVEGVWLFNKSYMLGVGYGLNLF